MSTIKNKYLLLQDGIEYLKAYMNYKDLLNVLLNSEVKEMANVAFSKDNIDSFYIDDSDRDGLFPMYFVKKSLKEQVEFLIFKFYKIKWDLNVGPVYFNGLYVSLWLYGRWFSIPINRINNLIQERRIS